MSVNLIIGVLVALVGLVAGVFFGKRQSSASKATEAEHKVEVERRTLDQAASDEYAKKIASVQSESDKIAGKAPSDILSNMINNGEVSR